MIFRGYFIKRIDEPFALVERTLILKQLLFSLCPIDIDLYQTFKFFIIVSQNKDPIFFFKNGVLSDCFMDQPFRFWVIIFYEAL